jgi:hypothetical protein
MGVHEPSRVTKFKDVILVLEIPLETVLKFLGCGKKEKSKGSRRDSLVEIENALGTPELVFAYQSRTRFISTKYPIFIAVSVCRSYGKLLR